MFENDTIMKIYDNISTEVAENPVIANILSRSSVRRFDSDRAVSDSAISSLLHAAMAAPTGVNRRPWMFGVVTTPELRTRLAEALPFAKMVATAPVSVICFGDRSRFLDGEDSTLWVQDLAAASENILLAAASMGLGAVYTCLYPHEDRMEAVKSILGTPDSLVPFNLIPVGYPSGAPHPLDKWDPTRILTF